MEKLLSPAPRSPKTGDAGRPRVSGFVDYPKQGSLKDTCCNHLKHGVFHQNKGTPPCTRPCSGVYCKDPCQGRLKPRGFSLWGKNEPPRFFKSTLVFLEIRVTPRPILLGCVEILAAESRAFLGVDTLSSFQGQLQDFWGLVTCHTETLDSTWPESNSFPGFPYINPIHFPGFPSPQQRETGKLVRFSVFHRPNKEKQGNSSYFQFSIAPTKRNRETHLIVSFSIAPSHGSPYTSQFSIAPKREADVAIFPPTDGFPL